MDARARLKASVAITRSASSTLDTAACESEWRSELAVAYRQHRLAIFRYLLRKTGDSGRAEDLAQDVFTDVAAYLAKNDRAHATTPLIYTFARRRVSDEMRSAERRTQHTTLAAIDSQAWDRDVTEVASGLRALTEAVLALPPAQRRIFLMRVFDDRPFSHIASELNSTEGACKTAFTRARLSVCERCTQAGLTLRHPPKPTL